jgi:hypothetical protein
MGRDVEITGIFPLEAAIYTPPAARDWDKNAEHKFLSGNMLMEFRIRKCADVYENTPF